MYFEAYDKILNEFCRLPNANNKYNKNAFHIFDKVNVINNDTNAHNKLAAAI